jgi:transcriptional regulator with XRE-family HTH domain
MKQKRIKLGLSLRQAAELSGVSYSSIFRIENGNKRVAHESVVRYQNFLKNHKK